MDHLHRPSPAKAVRVVLRTFYSTIKDADPSLRFAFIAGISKLTKAKVFSTLMRWLNSFPIEEEAIW